MIMRLLMLVTCALLLTACANPPPKPVVNELVVLLPQADGKTGAVVVAQGTREAVIDSAYASARSGPNAAPQAGRESAEDVRREFAATLDAMPPAAVSFTVYFLTGRDEFTEESKGEIKRMLDAMATRPSPEVTVIGHTDRVGNDRDNDRLSLQRAERVKVMLVERGVRAGSIIAAGRGERELLVPTADNVDEPRNRRVEISVR